jgi:hypothetical protein
MGTELANHTTAKKRGTQAVRAQMQHLLLNAKKNQ